MTYSIIATITTISIMCLMGYAVHTLIDCIRDGVASTQDVEDELNDMVTIYRAPLHCRVNVVRPMAGPVALSSTLAGYARVEHELATAMWSPKRYTARGTLIM